MGCGGGVRGGWSWVLVDWTCWCVILRWNFAVLVDLGSCLRTRLDARPGHEVKNYESVALYQVSMTGLKQSW